MGHDTFDIDIKGSGYNIAVMIITGFMFGISIANCIYYSKISEKPSQAMGKSAAKAMLGVNAVLAAMCGVIFFWSTYKLLVANEDKYNTMKKYIGNTTKRLNKLHRNATMSRNELDAIDSSPMNMNHQFEDSDFSDWE